MKPSTIWTIGHSTRPIEEFIGWLKTHGVECLVDVRAIPYSRRHPQFHTSALSTSLKKTGIEYHHLPSLGGRRKSHVESPNSGWRNAGFRGYADYMQTQDFWTGLENLMEIGQQIRTVIMCAEAVPWRCHRSLIADALVSRGWTVRHILSPTKADSHVMTSFARIEHGKIHYPAETMTDFSPPLFD
ncbi:MAG TPA: DUF488 domain-containing protein [Nitrospiraceae bacterium]|nr:DUF488 domain-containing protein [Nitrospiraceae bacterium]